MRFWRTFLVAVFLAPCAFAQAPAALSGAFTARDGAGRLFTEGTFSCTGSNPCTGTYVYTSYPVGCPNPTGSADQVTLTGLDLAQPGNFNARIVLRNGQTREAFQSNGTCVVTERQDLTIDFTGFWDGSSASVVLPPREMGGPTGPLTISLSFRSSGATPPSALTGTLSGSSAAGSTIQANFSCNVAGPCDGTYTGTVRAFDCINAYQMADAFSLSGVDLSRPGAIAGRLRFNGFLPVDDTVAPGGICTLLRTTDLVLDFTGTWDGSSASLVIPAFPSEDGPITFVASFRAVSQPPFGLTVTSRIDSQTATATGQLQVRPQDVGTTQSVFVFGVAPRDRVQPSAASDGMPPLAKARGPGLEAKADAVACVLAQLDDAGQLVAVSPATLKAFVTGVISAQGRSVTILDNVPTINVAGTTFYVGYGPNGPAMIASGLTRNALTVPGARECRPQPPQTGWWWDPPPTAGARSPRDGTGYSIEAQGNALFFAAFLYDASGRSSWYVASGRTSVDGSLFTGDLLQASGGQTLGGAYRPFSSVANAGPITLAFDSATSGTMVWPGGSVPLGRFNIVPNGLAAPPRSSQPESGWWWNPQESGRGFFIEWQDGSADLAGYMYDDAGNPVWYITVVPTPDPMRLTGTWLSFGNGMTLAGPWQPHQLVNPNVAPVTVNFTSATTATMTLPNGRTTSLVRHRF